MVARAARRQLQPKGLGAGPEPLSHKFGFLLPRSRRRRIALAPRPLGPRWRRRHGEGRVRIFGNRHFIMASICDPGASCTSCCPFRPRPEGHDALDGSPIVRGWAQVAPCWQTTAVRLARRHVFSHVCSTVCCVRRSDACHGPCSGADKGEPL